MGVYKEESVRAPPFLFNGARVGTSVLTYHCSSECDDMHSTCVRLNVEDRGLVNGLDWG